MRIDENFRNVQDGTAERKRRHDRVRLVAARSPLENDSDMDVPETRYAKTADGVYLAYQVTGEGPVDVAWQFDWLGNVDLIWEVPLFAQQFTGIASFARLIIHDRRATGLSSSNVPPPNLETRAADLRAVLDAVGSERPVLAGVLEGGASSAFFAATNPERTHSVVWVTPVARSVWSPDYPWGARPEQVEIDERELEHWGTLEGARIWAEGEAKLNGRVFTEEYINAYARLSRNTATPDVARQMTRNWYETDVRSILSSVRVPTLLLTQTNREGDVEEAEYIASLMPLAELKLLPEGPVISADAVSSSVDEIRRFVGVEPPKPELDTVLATVLFTDIVGSTERQSALGDHAWKDLIQRHHAAVRNALQRWRGVEVDTAGDGFYATFDGPARAIQCALDIAQQVRALGIEVRAGVHTGECEIVDGKCTGIAVSIGARVASTAGPSEVRVSQTVKDLVAGSGLTFEDAGEHELKGVHDRWHLYRVME
jgi:class 3 adenylate cyclase/pimeloyl-ACP methyl ester carboxylesterase